jgi:hypothetical protein
LLHCILKLLASLTRASLVDEGTDQGNSNTRRSLYQWSPKDWEERQKDLDQILEAVVQQTDVFGPSNNGKASKQIPRCIDRVKRIIKTNVVLSALRRKHYDGKQNAGDNLEASCNATLFEKDQHIKTLLSKLLTKNHQSQITGGFRFKEDQELRRILAEKNEFPFALEKFPSFVRRIFNKLTRDYTIQHLSRYVSDDKEEITEKYGKDQGGRMSEQPPQKRLKTNTQNAAGRKNSKKYSERGAWSDEEKNTSKLGMQQKAPKPKNRQSQRKMYSGRRGWSDKEKNTLKFGIQTIGVGKWASIKQVYEEIFEQRTTGQIKDCYRTMINRGEIQN